MTTMSKSKIEKLSDSDLSDLLRAAENQFDKKTWNRLHAAAESRGWEATEKENPKN